MNQSCARLSKISRHLWVSRRQIFNGSPPANISFTLPEEGLLALADPIRREARSVADAIQKARNATALADEQGSDDLERQTAVRLTKIALQRYVRLVALGNPPIQLSENASRLCSENDSDGDTALIDRNSVNTEVPSRRMEVVSPEAQNDVMHLLGDEVHTMKQELFMSNRQRVWIGWRGWF